MFAEQREALEEIVTKIRIGRITRRTFLERANIIGLSSGVALSLLEACGDSKLSTDSLIVWESEYQPSGIYSSLVDTFNAVNKNGIHVIQNIGPVDTGKMREGFVNMLQSHGSQIDILSMDIIWLAEFAASKWTSPVNHLWSQSEQRKYLPGPIEGCTYNNQVWAIPHHVDVGLLYYRTDLIPLPPNTWDELSEVIMAASSQTKYGYVWQGAKYEGLVCNFVEVLYGYGGAILAPDNAVVVNSPEALQALTKMVSWIGTISPPDVLTFKELDAYLLWLNGEVSVMRNWPGLTTSNNDQNVSQISGKFMIHSLLYGGSNTVGHSCVGGWQLGINAFSKNQAAAWEFIQYMIGPYAQKYVSLKASLIATLTSVSDDPEVQAAHPFFKDIKTILQNAKPRPVSPKYSLISDAIQENVYQALTKQSTPSESLASLQSDLQSIQS